MHTKFLYKKRNIWVANLAVGLLIFGSCQKEKDIFLPFGTTADALRELMTGITNDAANSTTIEIDGSNPAVLVTTPRGIQILLTDVNNQFADQNGIAFSASASQKITFKATDVFEKPEMAGLGTVTQADFGQPLETIGMVKLEAFSGNTSLKLLADKTFEVRIPVAATGFQSDIMAFEGGWSKTSSEIKFRWSLASDFAAPQIQPIPDGVKYYQLEAKKLGWIAGNRILPNAPTQIHVKLKEAFSLTNTLAFLVFDNQKSVFPLKFDLSSNLFTNGKVPVGQSGKLVFVSKIGDQLFLGTKEIVTDNDQVYDLSQEMRETTEAELKAALQNLK